MTCVGRRGPCVEALRWWAGHASELGSRLRCMFVSCSQVQDIVAHALHWRCPAANKMPSTHQAKAQTAAAHQDRPALQGVVADMESGKQAFLDQTAGLREAKAQLQARAADVRAVLQSAKARPSTLSRGRLCAAGRRLRICSQCFRLVKCWAGLFWCLLAPRSHNSLPRDLPNAQVESVPAALQRFRPKHTLHPFCLTKEHRSAHI